MVATYVERILRTAFGLLAAALLLTLLVNLQPGRQIVTNLSTRTNRPVAQLVATSLPYTLTTLGTSLAYGLPLALLLGIPAGRKPHGRLDRLLQAPAVALMGVPAFVASLLAVRYLALQSGQLSTTTAAQLGLALLLAGWLARAVRNGLADCRTDGVAALPWGRAALIILGRILQQTGNLLALTMVAEIAGGGGGRGVWGLVAQAVANRDIPVVYAALWAIIPVVLAGHLAGDLLVTFAGGERDRTEGGRISRTWLVLGGLLMLVLLALPFFGGDVNPDAIDVVNRLLKPGPGHPLGMDQLGRDLLARTAAGARVSLLIALYATFVALLPSALLAAVGWATGKWGMAILTPRTALPNLFGPLLAGLVGALLFKPSLIMLVFCLGAASVPAMIMAWRQFFLPGRTLAPVGRALPALFGAILLTFAQILLAEGALSFMGVGVQPPMASLGAIAAGAVTFLARAPHMLWPLLLWAAGLAGLFLVGHSLTGTGRESL